MIMQTVWRSLGRILFISVLLFFGCAPKEPTLEERVAQAEALLDAGQIDAAIRLLNVCQEQAPERVDVLEALAFAHSAQGDVLFSSMIFIQIAELVPERPEYRLYAAESLREAGDDTAAIVQYRMYLLTQPKDTAIWVTLADIYEAKGNLPDALECLLAAEQIKSRPKQKIRIGDLYLRRANLAQAQAWFSRAVEDRDARDEALLGLLETAIRAKRFVDGEALVERLDAEYPGRLDETELAELRPQLKEWRRRQDEAAAALAAIEERPALETPPVAEAVDQEVEEEVSATESVEDSTPASPEAEITEAPELVATEPPPPPSKLDQARELRSAGDRKGSIRLLKQVLVEDDSAPELWAELSETYLEEGEARWAQATANEAIRRDPLNPKWVLYYLRAAQETLSPDRLISEMESALRRFPKQPDLMLVLARAHAKQGNVRNARLLYESFLREAPNHPQRAEAESELFQAGG